MNAGLKCQLSSDGHHYKWYEAWEGDGFHLNKCGDHHIYDNWYKISEQSIQEEVHEKLVR